MVLLIGYGLLIALNLFNNNSKLFFTSLLVYLWMLFGWSYGNADWDIYVNRYEQYQSMSSSTEFLFTKLLQIGHWFNLDYRGFLILLSGSCLFLIAKTIMDLSKRPGFVLALYAIFTFPVDVTQVRFFVGFSIACYGFRYLFKYKEHKRNRDLLKWVVSVLLGSMVHFSLVCLLFLLVPLTCSRKKTITITLCINTLFMTLSSLNATFFSVVSQLLSDEKATFIYNASQKYNDATIRYVWFKISVVFIGFLLMYFAVKRWNRKCNISQSEIVNPTRAFRYFDFAMDCNIAIMVILGFVTLTTDFYRIQQVVVMINYIVYSTAVLPKRQHKLMKQNVLIEGIAVAFAFSSLYFLVLRGPNIDTVFYPIFYNNVLFPY